jgi:hypothetical protein
MTVRSYADIDGWFFWHDRMMFDILLDAQEGLGVLVELGAYLGRSAVIIGDHVRTGERFVVVDLFGDESALTESAHDNANRAENRYSYATLTRQRFELNYLALHNTLPEIVQAPSSTVVDHVEPRSAHFVHIDASHLYAQVAEDILNAQNMLQPNGIVVFDDYSNPNTPGVAGAVWEAVVTGGLVPFAVTPHKMYATWGNPARWLAAAREFGNDERMGINEQTVFGHTIARLKPKPQQKAARVEPNSAQPDGDDGPAVAPNPQPAVQTGRGNARDDQSDGRALSGAPRHLW